MDPSILNILKIIAPGVIAIVGNIIFYWIIKSRIDKSIEKHKISYAGIYQEKIKIHKELLRLLFELKQRVQQYQYVGDEKLGNDLFLKFNEFISYYRQNQPFIKADILEGIKLFVSELQGAFDNFFMHNRISKEVGIKPELRTEVLQKFFSSGNKFKKNQPFSELENKLIIAMKKDLNIDD